MKITIKSAFQSVFLSILILITIMWGLHLSFEGHIFWSYFSFFLGGLSIYFLCLKYFEEK